MHHSIENMITIVVTDIASHSHCCHKTYSRTQRTALGYAGTICISPSTPFRCSLYHSCASGQPMWTAGGLARDGRASHICIGTGTCMFIGVGVGIGVGAGDLVLSQSIRNRLFRKSLKSLPSAGCKTLVSLEVRYVVLQYLLPTKPTYHTVHSTYDIFYCTIGTSSRYLPIVGR